MGWSGPIDSCRVAASSGNVGLLARSSRFGHVGTCQLRIDDGILPMDTFLDRAEIAPDKVVQNQQELGSLMYDLSYGAGQVCDDSSGDAFSSCILHLSAETPDRGSIGSVTDSGMTAGLCLTEFGLTPAASVVCATIQDLSTGSDSSAAALQDREDRSVDALTGIARVSVRLPRLGRVDLAHAVCADTEAGEAFALVLDVLAVAAPLADNTLEAVAATGHRLNASARVIAEEAREYLYVARAEE